MKTTGRLMAAVMALAMVSAIAPMAAFADDTTIDQTSSEPSGTMTTHYNAAAKYTITIPADVTLNADSAVESSITAENVLLDSGAKVTVTLAEASNTKSGSTFHATNPSWQRGSPCVYG